MSEALAPPVPAAAPSSRLQSIDCLRGCAALAVVLYHVSKTFVSPESWHHKLAGVFYYGKLGVPLFFVISGFCIHLRWAKQNAASGKQTIDAWDFWKRRILRLYPAYVVALCITMALVVAAHLYTPLQPFVQAAPAYPQQAKWFLGDFVSHLLMLHGLYRWWDEGGGNEVYWTLAREEYFYLLYFALLYFRRTRGLALVVGLVFFISLVAQGGDVLVRHLLHVQDPAQQPWLRLADPSTSALALWFQWVLGMVAVESYFGTIKLPRWCSWPAMALFWFVLGLANHKFPQFSAALWGMSFFTLINYCVEREKAGAWTARGLSMRLTQVGAFSYSLYLVHLPVVRLLCGAEGLLRARLGGQAGPVYYAVGFILITAIATLAGWVFFHLVERHFVHGPQRREADGIIAVAAASPAIEAQAAG